MAGARTAADGEDDHAGGGNRLPQTWLLEVQNPHPKPVVEIVAEQARVSGAGIRPAEAEHQLWAIPERSEAPHEQLLTGISQGQHVGDVEHGVTDAQRCR